MVGEKVKATDSKDGISCVLNFPQYHDPNISHTRRCVGVEDSKITLCHCLSALLKNHLLRTSEKNGNES